MVKEFHKEILNLKHEVIDMAKLALNMLENSVKSIETVDVELAKEIIHKKYKIREYDAQIEGKALKLIALYQPMAVDLRTLACILKMITYLTRIGRYGKGIAQSVFRNFKDNPIQLKLINLQHIFEHVRDMISDAIEAFDKSNISLLEDFEKRDDEVDQLRWAIFRECLTYMMEDPKYITSCAHYLMFARYLERCGDHACKMAEKIWYMVTGERVEIS